MDVEHLPHGLVPAGASPNFTQDTIPEALQREHTLAAGRWGVLQVLEGKVVFVDLETGRERMVEAPDHVVIRPGVPHKVSLYGPLTCRIDFFRESSGEQSPGP